MGLPFTQIRILLYLTQFVFGARFATPRMALGTAHAPSGAPPRGQN